MKKAYLTSLLMLAAIASYAAEQRQIVAAVLVLEAGGEGSNGMKAVAEVIANRAAQHGTTLEEEATKPKQFSCLNEMSQGEAIKLAKRHPKWREAMEIADRPAKAIRDTNLTHGATFYHNKRCKPHWASKMRETAIIGKHIFYTCPARKI